MAVFNEYAELRFIKNRYLTWYYDIINRALAENRQKNNNYYEAHHILPRALFAEFQHEKWNLVLLTAREHFLCHLLLRKFTVDTDFLKMNRAADFMSKIGNVKVPSRIYQSIKENLKHTTNTKQKISVALSNKPKSNETKQKMSIAKKGKKSNGRNFPKGNIPWNSGLTGKQIAWNKGLSGNFLGQKHNEGTKEKMKIARANNAYNQKTCPHCNKTLDIPNFARHHGDKCKFKELTWQ